MARVISTNYLSTGLALTNTGDSPVYIDPGVSIAYGSGIGLRSNLLFPWSVTNASGASISGNTFGVSLASASNFVNAGQITASYAAGTGYSFTGGIFTVLSAGVFVGGGTVSNSASGIISAPHQGVAIGASGTLLNAGAISATNANTGFGVAFGAGGTVTNQTGGSISGTTYGVFSDGALSITNQAGAGISGGSQGIYAINGTVSLTNQGTLRGGANGLKVAGGLGSVINQSVITGTSAAIFLGIGGTITNATGGSLGGGFYGLRASGSVTITNQGAINGATVAGALLSAGGSIANLPGGQITGGIDGVVALSSAPAVVVNQGLIKGNLVLTTQTYAFGGVILIGGGSVNNEQGGTIIGGRYGVWASGTIASTVTNAGSIGNGANGPAGGAGVVLTAGGLVNNSGLITSEGYSVRLAHSPGTVTNTGTIFSSALGYQAGDAIGSPVALFAGGSVTNGVGGIIAGKYLGVQSGAFYPVLTQSATQAAAITVVNQGTISASNGTSSGAAVWMHGPGVVINRATGTIEGGTNGPIVGGPLNGLVSGPFGIVAYYQTTVINYGSIGGSAYAFKANNSKVPIGNRIEIAPGSSFGGKVVGANNAASAPLSTLEMLSGASTGTVSGVGSRYLNFGNIAIDSGASWNLTGSVGAGTSVAFAGIGDTLTLANPTQMQGTVTGFAEGDALELAGITVTGSSYAGGVLTLTDTAGAVTIALPGTFGANSVVVTNNAGGAAVSLQRTLSWTGGGGVPDFAAAANWNDVTDALNPAQTGPVANDTAALLAGGGSIRGTGVVQALTFGGPAQWLLTGTNLTATGTAGVSVGAGGSGVVTLNNGASVISQGATDVVSGTAQGATVTVAGPGSTWNSHGALVIGGTGLGDLEIQATGTVTAGAGLVIANGTAAAGSSVDVSGAGSGLSVTGTLVVGAAGFGALQVGNGASVTASSIDLASGATGDGVLSVVGAGTSLTVSGSLVVGDQSSGEMSILGGAAVSIGGGLVGGTGANASGNLDVEGAGSHLTINGGTLVVGATGPAVYTLGQGTTQTGAERTAVFGIANLGGLQDPPYITNDSASSSLNSGYVGEADIAVRNSGTYTVKPQSGTFAPPTVYSPDITFDPDPTTSGGSVNGVWVIQSLGTLILNATTVDASQTIDFGGVNAAKLVIGQVPEVSSAVDADNAFIIDGSISQGSPNVLAGFSAPIQNYQSGDVIVLRGLTYGSATASGDVVTVWSGAGATGTALGSLVFLDKKGNDTGVTVVAEALAASVQLTAAALACFAEGTRIATPEGAVRVEELRVGDFVLTADGTAEPIVWLGHRHIDCRRHPDPASVSPIRIRAGAFGSGLPSRDLWLSPDHAIFVDGVLIPAKLLINGTTISRVKRPTVTYHHVELREHAVILAEDLPVESYLDSGDRADFSNGGDTVRLFPGFTARIWEMAGCAPLVTTGPVLERARDGLEDRSNRSRAAGRSSASRTVHRR